MKVWRKKQKKKKRSSTGSPSPCSSSEDEESFVKKNKFWLQRRFRFHLLLFRRHCQL